MVEISFQVAPRFSINTCIGYEASMYLDDETYIELEWKNLPNLRLRPIHIQNIFLDSNVSRLEFHNIHGIISINRNDTSDKEITDITMIKMYKLFNIHTIKGG